MRTILTCLLCTAVLAAADRQVVFEQPQCAGISGLRPFWDRPVVLTADGAVRESSRGKTMAAPMAIWGRELEWHAGHMHWGELVNPRFTAKPVDPSPGALAFDAVHRSLLVRFPGLAQRLADELAVGGRIAKVELHLPFRAYEKLAMGYREPSSFIGKAWDELQPRWHAQAWRLRRAWSADPRTGPTFNGPVNGRVSWARWGATDAQADRFPASLGPAEVSQERSEAIDLTACLSDPAYGASLGERLRGLEDCGVLVQKVEQYDMRYETPQYEWGTMTGGRGILVQTPRLVVTLADAPAQRLALPPPADPAAGGAWKPTAVIPDEAAFTTLRERFAPRRPAWMPEWQWQRIGELRALDPTHGGFPATRIEYLKWVDDILRTPPRTWIGFSASAQLGMANTYLGALPGPAVDAMKAYWHSWLLPHLSNRDIVHNQYHQIWTPWRKLGSDFHDATGDWRGNRSFYRESYNGIMSTMNYNHTSALGALLGGHFIGAGKAMADGRFGLEMFPMRLWAWYDGTTQESIDHYYFSHTLTAQKMFVDFAPTAFDRMIGESILAKSIEELAACYHPALRRFVSTSGRTGIAYVLAINEGVGSIVHTLSPNGALTDLGGQPVAGIPVVGKDFPPGHVAEQAMHSPWGPAWTAELLDAKPLPFAMTASFKQWGSFVDPVKWKKSWLGRRYGVASYDCAMGTVQQMAVWNRNPAPATTATDIGLLTVRFGFNRTNMLDTLHLSPKDGKPNANGILGEQGGATACLQHRGTMLVLSSPYAGLASTADLKPTAQPITSIQTTVMLATVQAEPSWRIVVDGKPAGPLPLTLQASSRIAIDDGGVFIGLVPIPATVLGARDAEVVIRTGGPPVKLQGGGELSERLLIESYHYRSDQPFDLAGAAPGGLDRASGGFVILAADDSEGDFTAFQRRLAAGTLSDAWDEAKGLRSLAWKDGADLMEVGYLPVHGTEPKPTEVFAHRRVNGAWPYLAPGMERETTVSAMGRTGRLEKHGAVLRHQPGTMGYLLVMPGSGALRFANPLPDLAWQRFSGPGGLTVEADGQVGILTVDVDPAARRLDVKHAIAPGTSPAGIATALLVGGLDPAEVLVDRIPLAKPWQRVQIDGASLLVVPLGSPVELAALPARVAAARTAAEAAFAATDPGAQPRIRCEPGKGAHLLTRPRPGAVRFHRQWHDGTAFIATVPEGPTVTADGRVALRSLLIDVAANAVEIDAPRYYQTATNDAMRFADKASAIVIRSDREPAVVLNEEPVKPVRSLRLDGRTAWLVPLPGGEALRDDAGIATGVAAAEALLK